MPKVSSEISKYVLPFTVITVFVKNVLPSRKNIPLNITEIKIKTAESLTNFRMPFKISEIIIAVKNFADNSIKRFSGRNIVSEVIEAKPEARIILYVLTLILRKSKDSLIIK